MINSENDHAVSGQGWKLSDDRDDPILTKAPSDPAIIPPDTEMVTGGAEFGINRFCEQAFVSPESARVGGLALLKAFDGSGLWLASLVHPQHLLAELRQQSCQLTRVVVTQWTRQGETHKLVKLAEALMDAKPPVLSHEAGQIMALLASLLGILRPAQSPRWLAASIPLLKDSLDPHLLKEASQWVAVGQSLESLPPEDRLLWNRRLRDPEDGWDWDSPEALNALQRIVPILRDEDELLPIFQAAVPRCWWEMWRTQQSSQASLPPQFVKTVKKASVFSMFSTGLMTGVVCMILAGWWAGLFSSVVEIVEVAEQESVEPDPPVFSFHAVEPIVPIEDKPLVAVVPPVEVPKPKPPPRVKRLTPVKIEKSPVLSVHMQARLAEAEKIAEAMPELTSLHSLVKAGSMREAEPHVQGRTMVAAKGTRQYRALLRWLLLDPPLDTGVRESVGKAAVRVLGAEEMYETLQLCLHPDSPNLAQARECASLLLALGSQGLNAIQKEKLTAQTSSGASN